jgi:peptide/nickel transport system permease protein
MRAEVIKTRRAVFVEAAVLQGGSRTHVLLRHVLPNASRSLLALAVLQFGLSILVIAGLAFLGYGDPPPASDWGLLVSSGKDYPTAPWLVYAPALIVVATVVSVNRISRWLRRTD